MKILSTEQIRLADNYTIENEPILSVNLMERAGKTCFNWIIKNFNNDFSFKIFVGQGNNGGDGLVIARLLSGQNYKLEVFIMKLNENYSDDFLINLERLKQEKKVQINVIEKKNHFPKINENDIIIDALFGSGLSRYLKDFPADLVYFINEHQNICIAIDIPSGLFSENNELTIYKEKPAIIQANYTLTFQFPKLCFFFPETEKYIGKYFVFSIGLHQKFIKNILTKIFFVEKGYFFKKNILRKKFAHKGNFGHAFLVAGSYGKIGANILASKACMRTGVGLLTSHVPQSAYIILQISVPEAMISVDNHHEFLTEIPNLENYNAIGIGCGIGQNIKTKIALENLLKTLKNDKKKFLVLDADAINLIGKHRDLLNDIPLNTIFTPHLKEFERLIGIKAKNDFERQKLQIDFAKKYHVYLVLKGANTTIACPNGDCFFNTTGNSGMATAGSGDVLTGIILSLLAQNYTPKEASIFGVYLHGLAGDFAKKKYGEQALIASDIIENIGNAYEFM